MIVRSFYGVGVRISLFLWGVAAFASQVQIDSTSYLNTKGNAGSSDRQVQRFSLRLENTEAAPFNESGIKYSLFGSLQLDQPKNWAAEAPELYGRFSLLESKAVVDLGRRLVPWSRADESWNRGVWEPRYRHDLLESERVGLVGGFFEVQDSGFSLVAFGSPVFIPERGVNCIPNDQGSFDTNSPWCVRPPQQAAFLDQTSPISYSVDVPPLNEILLQPSAGATLGLEDSSGLWFRGSYAYQPIHQPLLSIEGFHDLSTLTNKAILHPRFVYHQLVTTEVGIDTQTVEVWTSLTYDLPEATTVPIEWINQETSASWTWVSEVGGKPFALLGLASPKRSLDLGLGYLKQWGGLASDSGDKADAISFFTPLTDFQDAVRARASLPIASSLEVSGSWLEEFTGYGRWVSAKLDFSPRAQLKIFAQADYLSVTGKTPDAPKSEVTDFIGRYRSNDRFTVGFNYGF